VGPAARAIGGAGKRDAWASLHACVVRRGSLVSPEDWPELFEAILRTCEEPRRQHTALLKVRPCRPPLTTPCSTPPLSS
jgi:hypothetical protein